MKKIFVVVLSVFSVFLCSCSLKEEVVTEELNKGALEDVSFKTGNDGYEVRGTVRLPESGRVIAGNVLVLTDTELSVKGTMVCESGSMNIVYITEDETEIIIYDGEGEEIDTVVKVPKGKGKLYFIGSNAVYSFSIEISNRWIICYM